MFEILVALFGIFLFCWTLMQIKPKPEQEPITNDEIEGELELEAQGLAGLRRSAELILPA